MAAIDLSPAEWGLATWRPLAPPPTEAPRPFDPAVLRREIKAARNEWGMWRWKRNPLPAVMTREEATFWLRATVTDSQLDPSAAAEQALADDSELGDDEAFLLALHSQLPTGAEMTPLPALLDPADIAERLLGPMPTKPIWSRYGGSLRDLVSGVRIDLVPRLAAADLDRLAAGADAAFRRALADPDYKTGWEAKLGAQLGCHELVFELTRRWPDKWFADSGGHGYDTIALGLPSADALREVAARTRMRPVDPQGLIGWLAHFEEDAFDAIAEAIESLENRPLAEQHTILFGERVHGAAAAPAMLRLTRTSRGPKPALAWLEEHPDAAREGLPRTPEGTAMLRRLGLVEDPLAALPEHPGLGLRRPRKPPSAAGLPPLVVDRQRLPDADVEAVLAALASGASLPPLDDPEDFAWELFESWLMAGAPTRDKWRMTALGRLGGDATALRLAPLIRAWPGEGQHKRAVLGLDVLREIGSDTALMQLNGIAQKLKFKALQARAREAMEEIAADLGLSRAQLEDRIVPDCGLDADGRRVFEDGSEFVLGPDMKPLVRDARGKLRAGKGPDWKLFRKQVAEVAKVQAVRLEQAMVSGRSWPAEEFERLLVHHPLQRHLVRRLVWSCPAGSFRVTEEGDYAGVDDAAFALSGPVRIAHPLLLSAAELSGWGELFADYELVSPFPQLGRPVYELEPGEEALSDLTRFARATVPAVTLIGLLERADWQRGDAHDGGFVCFHFRHFADATAVVAYEGWPLGYPTAGEDQAVQHCYVLDGITHPRSYHAPGGKRWGDVDPVVRSEVLAMLEEISARSR